MDGGEMMATETNWVWWFWLLVVLLLFGFGSLAAEPLSVGVSASMCPPDLVQDSQHIAYACPGYGQDAYLIAGASGVVYWNDNIAQQGSDEDFNDSVVRYWVSGTSDNGLTVNWYLDSMLSAWDDVVSLGGVSAGRVDEGKVFSWVGSKDGVGEGEEIPFEQEIPDGEIWKTGAGELNADGAVHGIVQSVGDPGVSSVPEPDGGLLVLVGLCALVGIVLAARIQDSRKTGNALVKCMHAPGPMPPLGYGYYTQVSAEGKRTAEVIRTNQAKAIAFEAALMTIAVEDLGSAELTLKAVRVIAERALWSYKENTRGKL